MGGAAVDTLEGVEHPLTPPLTSSSRAGRADARRPLTRILDVLEDERYVLTRLTDDDRVFEVLVELDELQFAIIEPLASFESERGSG